jgi:uncharacterized protein YjbI with pentapeptide repeats
LTAHQKVDSVRKATAIEMLTPDTLRERYAGGERNFTDVKLGHADLRGADLSGADLSGADLSHSNLGRANLSNARLTHADLSNAFLNGVILRGAHLSHANLNFAYIDDADLSYAKLVEADLSRAGLRGTDLGYSDLTCCRLVEADLSRARLYSAILTEAVLIRARLTGADLRQADLRGADLTEAELWHAEFRCASLIGADLTGASLDRTMLLELDLSPLCRCHTLKHRGPSDVDFKSIVLSLRAPRLKEFLRHTGMPDVFVEYMVDCGRSLDPKQLFSLLQSTFISYGGPDEVFARKLNDALARRGAITFFFKDDAPAGEKLHRVMRRGVNGHDRVILVCSEASLRRPGVLNELEETLARESRDGGRTYLLPVRLDDYVIDGWNPADPDVAQTLRDRVIADFREHEDPHKFDAQVAKLVAALKKPIGATADL